MRFAKRFIRNLINSISISNMATEDFNDNMHQLIIDRLRERHRKTKIMNDYEKPKKIRSLSFVSLIAAACFIGIFILFPDNKTINPTDAPIRSSMENVRNLIDEGRYGQALAIVEKELYSTDSTLNELRMLKETNDEETLYEIQVLELRIKELTKKRDYLKKKLK